MNENMNSSLDFSDLFNSIEDLVFILDYDGNILKFNKCAIESLSYTKDELLNMTFFDLHPPKLINDVKSIFNSILNHKGNSCTIPVITKEKELIPVNTKITKGKWGEKNILISICRDVTEYKEAELELKESEKKYSAMVKAFDGLIYMCSQDFKVEFMNNNFIKRTGYDGTGALCYKALHDLDEICSWCVNERVFKGETVKWEVQSPKDNHWFYIVNTPINHSDGTISKMAMILDITEIKEIQQKLSESEKKFRTFTESSPAAVLIYQNYQCVYANYAATQITGYTIEELSNMNFWDFLHPDYKELAIEGGKALEKGETPPYESEIKIITKDHHKKWIDARMEIIEYQGKKAVIIIALDITKRKQIEKELNQSNAENKAILSANPDLIFEFDKNGIYTLVKGNERDLYLLPDEFIGKKITAILPEDVALLTIEKINKTLQTGETQVFEYKLPVAGEQRYWEARMTISRKDRVMAVIREITQRKKAELDLEQSKEKYRKAYNQAEFYKDLLIHDTNNILQSFFSSIELLDLDIDEFKSRKNIGMLLEIIHRQIQRGIKLISNVHTLSQLENYEISFEQVNLLEILNQSIEFLKNSFQKRKIKVKINSFNEALLIIGNDLLQDVFENILLNSVKHNKNDAVEILIKIREVEQDHTVFYKLEFIDNGIGIEDKRKEKVLDRVDLKSKPTYGVGLGLSLVKKIIDKYYGNIWIEDKVNGDYSQGTNVILLLPKGVC